MNLWEKNYNIWRAYKKIYIKKIISRQLETKKLQKVRIFLRVQDLNLLKTSSTDFY